jgi:hypothetical protein
MIAKNFPFATWSLNHCYDECSLHKSYKETIHYQTPHRCVHSHTKDTSHLHSTKYGIKTQGVITTQKVKLSCALTEHQAMKADWGSGSIATCIL